MLRYLILGLLRTGVPHYGYAVMKAYRDATGVEIAVGNVYREFRRLVELAWIRSVPNPAGADPRRAPYEITRKGIAALDAWLLTPLDVPHSGAVDDLSLRTLLVARSATVLDTTVLDHWHRELLLCHSMLQHQAAALKAGQRSDTGDGTPLLVALMTRRLEHIGIDLDFVERVRAASVTPGPGHRPPAPARKVRQGCVSAART